MVSFNTPILVSTIWRLARELSGLIHSTDGGGSPAATHSRVTVLPVVAETGLEGVVMILGSPESEKMQTSIIACYNICDISHPPNMESIQFQPNLSLCL